MEAVFVDDNVAYTEELTDREWSTDHVQFIPAGSREIGDLSSREIAKRVAEEVGDDDAVVLINVNLKIEGKSRQDQAGVEVLKFLRLTEHFDERNNEARDTHCVMYSFHSVEQLLREKPSSLILCSNGVTFKRLPSELSELDLRELAEEKASVDDLDKFLRGEFRLPDERHSWANWWGLKQLYDVHRLVLDTPDLGYPELVEKNLRTLEARKGACIYDYDESFYDSGFERLKNSIKSLRKNILSKDVSAIQIDDQWRSGWGDIFADMITKEENNGGLYPVNIGYDELSSEDIKDGVCNRVKRFIKNYSIDVILLDLRLSSKDVGSRDVGTFTGTKILKELRKEFKGVPVIVTTASNKAWSNDVLTKLGADGYWIKEGIDESRDKIGTIKNYAKILELIDISTGSEYRFLRWFDKKVISIKEIVNNNGGWWSNKEWSNGDITNASSNCVLEILDESVLMMRSYLTDVKMNNIRGERHLNSDESNLATRNESFWVTAIIQQISNVVERIHDLRKGDTKRLYKDERFDYIALTLHSIRNQFSHSGWFGSVDFLDLKLFIEMTSLWLENEDYNQGVRGTINSDGEWFAPDIYTFDWDDSPYKLTKIYARIFWWLTEANEESDVQILRPHKNRLIKTVLQILSRERQEKSTVWNNITSHFVDDDGNPVRFDNKVSNVAEEFDVVDSEMFT